MFWFIVAVAVVLLLGGVWLYDRRRRQVVDPVALRSRTTRARERRSMEPGNQHFGPTGS